MNILKRLSLAVVGLFVLSHTVQAHYDPNIGRWISRDPIAEIGGMNLYEYAGNDGINAIDNLGLWKSWTHRHLTDHAWKQVNKPDDMTSRIQKDLIKILKKRNVDVDSGETFKILAWHFNRAPDGKIPQAANISQAIKDYLKILSSTQKEISKDLKSPSKETCADALDKIGQLSHAWQDYYAHAVNKGYAGGTDFQNIGYISGDPEHPGADVKPSSWGGIWDPEEHRWVEPGKRAPDHAQREQAATAFTQKGYQAFLDKWWPVCKCFYLK